MTTLEDKLRELGGIDEVISARKQPVREKQHASGHRKRPTRGAAMKYIAAIALILAFFSFIRAGVLECRVMGEALSARCLIVGAWLSWPQPAKTSDGKSKRSAAR